MCKILVVEDKPDYLSTLAGSLTDCGDYVVNSATTIGNALDIALEDEPDFAVIDVRLLSDDPEDESGLSLALALRKITPEIRIVLITGGEIRPRQVVRALKYQGVIDFIPKGPDVVSQIREAIEKACREPQRADAEVSGETRLNLSLISGQPLFLRAHGRFVHSGHTGAILRVDAERYARRTELARKNAADMRFQVEEIGNRLWDEVFAQHREAAEVYAGARKGRLTMVFETSRELVRLPLEFMRSTSPAEYLVLQHPVSRVVFDVSPNRETLSPQFLSRSKKLRILLIASNTEPPIPGVETEVQELAKFLSKQKPAVAVTLLSSSQASYGRVQDELKKTNYDIIHYAGHGFFDAASPEDSYLLFWQDASTKTERLKMKATELKLLLDQSEARMVYLSCCYGAAATGNSALLDDDFLGLTDAVVQAGVPSVLGFRWPVSDAGAHKLALSFYRSLLEQGRPDVALWHARRELAVNRNEPTWLSPILIHQE